jgi:crotonobetainyl-CoA:carnitine CoA-transferase CaiB-like acyl-CoA transferase
MGLLARERFGIGQYIETSMLCSTGYVHSNEIIDYISRPPRSAVDSAQCGFHALYRLYRCKSGWLFLAALDEQHWKSLVEALNQPQWLARTEFRGNAARLANDGALAIAVQHTLVTRSADEWATVLGSRGVPAEVADSKRFEQFLAENGVLEPDDHRTFGEYFRLRPRLRFSGSPNRRERAHFLGEDTRNILHELKYSPTEVQKLLESGAIFIGKGST